MTATNQNRARGRVKNVECGAGIYTFVMRGPDGNGTVAGIYVREKNQRRVGFIPLENLANLAKLQPELF